MIEAITFPTAAADPAAEPRSVPSSRLSSATVLLVLALAVGTANCLFVGWRAPLWLDESFTLAVVTEPNLARFGHALVNDVAGPLYYIVVRAWTSIAGTGDVALRLPSAAFLLLAPVVALAGGVSDPRTRRIWAALIATSTPVLIYASEARGYALAMLLATAQAVAYGRLVARPGTRAALAWTTLSTALVLTHMHGLFVTATQGLLYVGWHRGRAARTWPALAAFLPLLAWLTVALPTVRRFGGENSWYRLLDARFPPVIPEMLFGDRVLGSILLALIVATSAAMVVGRVRDGAKIPYPIPDMLVSASGILAVAIVVELGFAIPSFVPRYLIPAMPTLLFAVAMWACEADRRWPRASMVLVAAAIGVAIPPLFEGVLHPERDRRYQFSIEAAARWIAADEARALVIAWDSPPGRVMDDAALRDLGAAPFRRMARPIAVTALHLPLSTDPNQVLLGEARRRGAAILWLYDDYVPRTAGTAWPARIAAIDGRWRCRDDGRGLVHVIACLPPHG